MSFITLCPLIDYVFFIALWNSSVPLVRWPRTQFCLQIFEICVTEPPYTSKQLCLVCWDSRFPAKFEIPGTSKDQALGSSRRLIPLKLPSHSKINFSPALALSPSNNVDFIFSTTFGLCCSAFKQMMQEHGKLLFIQAYLDLEKVSQKCDKPNSDSEPAEGNSSNGRSNSAMAPAPLFTYQPSIFMTPGLLPSSYMSSFAAAAAMSAAMNAAAHHPFPQSL